MGRYYNGHISGKFWFGIQRSNDADFFGQTHRSICRFHVCGCTAYDLSVNSLTNYYCATCYPSYEAHLLSMLEQGIDVEKTWVSDGKIYYTFLKTDIQEVHAKILLLESYVGEHMEGFRIKDKDTIQYRFTMPGGIRGDEISLVARLCLGKQILYSLEKHGICEFVADL